MELFDLINLIELELLIGYALLCGIMAYGRPLAKQICIFCLIPVSYLVSYLLLKNGVLDGLGEFVTGLLMNEISLEDTIGGDLASVTSLANAVVNTLIRELLLVPIFWILYFLFRIIAKIIMAFIKTGEDNAFFRFNSGTPVWAKTLCCVLGVLGGSAVLMLDFSPVVFISGLVSPATEYAKGDEYEGTYVQELATSLDEIAVGHFGNSVILNAAKYTGVGAGMNGAVKGLADTEAKDVSGNTYSYNVNELVSNTLKDGVDGGAVYEYFQNPHRYPLSKFGCALNIVYDVAESPVIMDVASELILNFTVDKDEVTDANSGAKASADASEEASANESDDEDILAILIGICQENYNGSKTGAISNDLVCVGNIIKDFIDKNADATLDTEELFDTVLKYVSVTENAENVARNISSLVVGKSIITEFSLFGAKELCGMFGVNTDRESAFEQMKTDLHTALNDRSVARVDLEGLEIFIKYLAENGVNLSEYRRNNDADGEDIACKNYDLYFKRIENIVSIYYRYDRVPEHDVRCFVGSDGKVYVYDSDNEIWSETSNASAIDEIALLAHILIKEADMALEAGTDDIDPEVIYSWIDNKSGRIDSELSGISAAMLANVKAVAAFTTDLDSFDPDLTYTSDFVNSIRDSSEKDIRDEDVESFAGVMVNAGAVFTSINNSEAMNVSVILEHFGDIGKLLDSLEGFCLTESVPAMLFELIAMNREFTQYMPKSSIDSIVENVAEGKTNYETFFNSVQALYTIAMEVAK